MDKILEILGRGAISKVANHFGLKPWAVSMWTRSGVPAERVIPLCEFMDWLVVPHDVRPDLYPERTDGVPSATLL